jgi:cytoskeletal protein RodZ
MPFTQSKIHLDAETISEQLRSKRQELGLKLEKVAKDTRINIKYLNALEKGRFDLLPSGLYGKNYLREYANYLRLDTASLLDLYGSEAIGAVKVREGELFNTQVVKRHYFLSFPRIIRGLLIVVGVAVASIYLIMRLKGIVSPPTLEIYAPYDNLTTSSSSVELVGRSEPESQLSVNGEQIISDSYGNFSKNVSLQKGINLITVSAQKKYGRSSVEIRRVLRN